MIESKNIHLKKLKKVHFIGITSGFNSFCANYLIQKGIHVTASEINQDSKEAQDWIKKGILYKGEHNAKYITDDLDLVVYPNGPIPGNPECQEAEKKGIPSVTIAQLTGVVSKNFDVIAVAGTHGKTTTCGMIVWLLYKAYGSMPNYIIGDNIVGHGTWRYNKQSNYLVIESCEYKRQFLDRVPSPYISVITNIELDHTDYYKNQKDYNKAFIQFLSNTQNSIVLDTTLKNSKKVLRKLQCNLNIVDVSKIISEKQSPLPGDHNRENFMRAVGVAKVLNIYPDIDDFPGIDSRFEYKGETSNGLKMYLDYAHNPRKIHACIQEAQEIYPDKKIVLVWQPHSLERTYSFKKDFAKSLKGIDILLLPNIFVPTREKTKFKNLIQEDEFVEYLQKKNPRIDIQYTEDFENTKDVLLKNFDDEKYVAVFASAGDLKEIFNKFDLKK